MDIKDLSKKFLSFASVGALLTVMSLGSQYVFLKYYKFPLKPTYVCINTVLIFLSFYLNSKFTFKNKISFENTVIYYLIYGSSMALGYVLLWIFQKTLNFEDWFYPFMALPFTLTFNFLMSSKYLTLNHSV